MSTKKERDFALEYSPKENGLFKDLLKYFSNPQALSKLKLFADPHVHEALRRVNERLCRKKTKGVSQQDTDPAPNVVFPIQRRRSKQDPTNTTSLFNFQASYANMLHQYQKRYMDGFPRRHRVSFRFKDSQKTTINTAFCQLNFFRWAIESELLEHMHLLSAAMDTKTPSPPQHDHDHDHDHDHCVYFLNEPVQVESPRADLPLQQLVSGHKTLIPVSVGVDAATAAAALVAMRTANRVATAKLLTHHGRKANKATSATSTTAATAATTAPPPPPAVPAPTTSKETPLDEHELKQMSELLIIRRTRPLVVSFPWLQSSNQSPLPQLLRLQRRQMSSTITVVGVVKPVPTVVVPASSSSSSSSSSSTATIIVPATTAVAPRIVKTERTRVEQGLDEIDDGWF